MCSKLSIRGVGVSGTPFWYTCWCQAEISPADDVLSTLNGTQFALAWVSAEMGVCFATCQTSWGALGIAAVAFAGYRLQAGVSDSESTAPAGTSRTAREAPLMGWKIIR